ncbi:hypothetical protein [Acidovorax sp. Root219]|uniref:hypothetical protein n=1 Tax=Acidovorax sp. Root219 TaxID=1736493 RepID=UPI000A749A94|nr:hypothetical protein [Acidovorax sp. Root219]
MNNLHVLRVIGAALILLANTAWSDTTYKWVFVVLDGHSKAEVPGVAINFSLTDPRTKQQQLLNCETNDRGRCEITGTVSGGGLFTRGAVSGTFSILKEGYQKEFKSSGKLTGSNTEVLTVLLAKKSATDFSVVGTDGKPVEDARVFFLLGGAPATNSACTTNSAGTCTIEFPAFAAADGSVMKSGYYSEPVKSTGGQVTLTRNLDAALHAAAAQAKITCSAKDECDRAYALAQVYLARTATSKTQFSNDTITETFNPSGAGSIGGRITRMPIFGGKWEVSLESYCGSGSGPSDVQTSRSCDAQLLNVYLGYADFVQSKVR